MGHARAVATSDDADELTRQIIEKGLSVRQAEALAKKPQPRRGPGIARASARSANRLDTDIEALQRQLGDLLGLRVKVAHNGKAGSVVIHYSSLDQLDMICQRLSGEPF